MISRGTYGSLGPGGNCWPQMAGMVPDLDDEVYICICLHLSEIWQSLLFAILLICEASAILSLIPILSRLFCTSFLFFHVFEYQARETQSLGRQRGWDAVVNEGLCTSACCNLITLFWTECFLSPSEFCV